MPTKSSQQAKLNVRLLDHNFEHSQVQRQSYKMEKIIADHYAKAENAVAVLSNMATEVSYICYGRLGERLGLGTKSEEVESIWENKILSRIHPDDMAGKIAWELQFLAHINQLPIERRSDYYLQHYLRFSTRQGSGKGTNGADDYITLRHRIFYLDYDREGNVLLALCLYTASNEQQGVAGIYCSLDDTLVANAKSNTQGMLSDRECEVLKQLGRGLLSKQIAEALSISINTVNNHRQNILRKLHCQNTTEAVSVARRLGLLSKE